MLLFRMYVLPRIWEHFSSFDFPSMQQPLSIIEFLNLSLFSISLDPSLASSKTLITRPTGKSAIRSNFLYKETPLK